MGVRRPRFRFNAKKNEENLKKMHEAGTEARGRAGFYLDYTLRTDAGYYQEFFQPRTVTFGPVHHGQSKYERAEKFKLMMAERFIQDSGQQPDHLLENIAEHFYGLKYSYNEEVIKAYDDNDLAWMFFIDGCSILQFIHERHAHGSSSAPFEEQDLFLLENQIPYEVLRLLMESSTKYMELLTSVHKFVQQQFSTAQSAQEPNSAIMTQEINSAPFIETYTPTHTHLLDLLRKLFSVSGDTVIDMDEQRFRTFALLN